MCWWCRKWPQKYVLKNTFRPPTSAPHLLGVHSQCVLEYDVLSRHCHSLPSVISRNSGTSVCLWSSRGQLSVRACTYSFTRDISCDVCWLLPEPVHQNFLWILKRTLQNSLKILMKYVLCCYSLECLSAIHLYSIRLLH